MLSVSVNYSEPAQHIGLKIEPWDLVKFIVEKEGFSLVCRRGRLISAGRQAVLFLFSILSLKLFYEVPRRIITSDLTRKTYMLNDPMEFR